MKQKLVRTMPVLIALGVALGALSIVPLAAGPAPGVSRVQGAQNTGVAASQYPVLTAGVDGGGIVRRTLTDTGGRQIAVGASADGAPVSGNPVLAGMDVAGVARFVPGVANPGDGATVATNFLQAASLGYAFNGTSLDRVRTVAATANTPGVGLLGAGILGFDGTNYQPLRIGNADNLSTATQLAVSAGGYNGSGMDRWRNNIEGTALASSARTASTNSPELTNHNGRLVTFFLNVTANPGGGQTLTLALQARDPVSGNYMTIAEGNPQFGSGGTGMAALTVGPSVVPNSFGTYDTQPGAVPRSFRVRVIHSGGGSWTYSVGYALGV